MLTIPGHLASIRDTLTYDQPGHVRVQVDSSGRYRREVRLYNAYASAIPSGHPCLIRYDGDEETNPFVVSGASASGAIPIDRYCTPQASVAASSWGWFAFEGYCQALTVGTTDIAKDDYLKSAVTITAGLMKDGTTLTVNSFAIACEANTTDTVGTSTLVFLLGERCAIAQS